MAPFNARLSTRSLRQPIVRESRVPILFFYPSSFLSPPTDASVVLLMFVLRVIFFLICKGWETRVQDSESKGHSSRANSSDSITDNS